MKIAYINIAKGLNGKIGEIDGIIRYKNAKVANIAEADTKNSPPLLGFYMFVQRGVKIKRCIIYVNEKVRCKQAVGIEKPDATSCDTEVCDVYTHWIIQQI